MLIYTSSRNGNVSSIACAERVQAILDKYPNDEFESSGNRPEFVNAHGWRFHDFIAAAIDYGMAIKIHHGTSKGNPSIYAKTHNYPTFLVSPSYPTISTKPKVAKPRPKPKQGNGSVLKPQFNHAIAKPEIKPEVFRIERPRGSKLPIMNRLEDIGAFDVESQLAKLRMIR